MTGGAVTVSESELNPVTRPRKPRFSTMEVLGFSETPATIYDARQIWVETEAVSTQEQQKPDFFTSWLPSDFGTVLLGRRIRWGVVITTTLLVALVVATALWVYRRPTVEAARARDQVAESVAALAPELERLRTVNATLDAEEIDGGAATEVSLAVDAGVRRLFEAVGQLKEEDSDARTRLIAVTGQIAESARRFGDAVAVRSAVLPALVPADSRPPARVPGPAAASATPSPCVPRASPLWSRRHSRWAPMSIWKRPPPRSPSGRRGMSRCARPCPRRRSGR